MFESFILRWSETKKLLDLHQSLPGGGLSIFTDRDQRSIFLGFEFRKSVFFWVLLTAAVFFGLLDKCCIFKCFIFLTVFLEVQFSAPGASVIKVLHYYHTVLNFCQMNSALEGIF